MASLNICQFIGNVGASPEIRTFQDGGKVANLRIAVTERWKDRNGQPMESTEWVSLVVRGATVDVVEKYVQKGAPIYAQCKFHQREWTDQQGEKHYNTEFNVISLQLLGQKPQAQQPAPAPQYQQTPPPPAYPQPSAPPQSYQPRPVQPTPPAAPQYQPAPQPPQAPAQPQYQPTPGYPPMNDPSYTQPQNDDLPWG